ncbi:alginate export family protein [Sphingomonas sp. BT-65]|uniref:alginate export family protein n=1 Tax=Sphingomonas sp. BT-65 TaxID=2989821 RepID=UPI0022354C29|nr:alginate export family protein [Sphingomonas sp. BT-65]MCW4461225.1 alginate export family protein [Sphingomonas sp. BT-65]
MLRAISLACLSVCAAQSATAQQREGLDLSATMRLRYEAIDNQLRVGFDPSDTLVNLRTTLLASYREGPLTLTAELWDSRVWGDDPGTPVSTGEVNTFELVQVHAAWRTGIGKTRVTLQGGRFTLNIGSRRLVAADDYRNTTNGYTGLRAEIAAPGGVSATAVYVLPQQRRPDDNAALRRGRVEWDHEGFDQVLWGGTLAKAKAIGPVSVEASFFHLGERDTPGRSTRDRSLNTWGGRVMRDPAAGKADFEVEAFHQSGTVSASAAANAARLPVSASFVHADLGYTLTDSWKTRLSLEYDRASGDRAGGRYGRFDTLFGMRRADLAPAGLYNAVGRANIVSFGPRIETAPSKRVDLTATWHAMWLAERTDSFSTTGIRDASGRAGSFAGNQFDARLRWWVRPERLRFEWTGVVLAKGRFLRDAPNAPRGGTTVYNSLNLTASF